MIQMSYSDGLYFNSLCEQLCQSIETGKDLFTVADRIRNQVDRIRKKANGYWSLPKGRLSFLQALEALASVLDHHPTVSTIQMLKREFTQVLFKVNPRCRVLFLAQEVSVWPSLQGVYETMSADPRFETRLVYVPFIHPNQKKADTNFFRYQKMGLPVQAHTDYSLTEDNPDIVFFAKPYDQIPKEFYISEVERIVEKTVYIPYGMETNYNLVRYGFQDYLHYRVWRHVVYGEFVKSVGARWGYRNGENIVVWGHPRMDYYRSGCHPEIPSGWGDKIRGKRVICWCPHHTILLGPERVSTWMENHETVFEQIRQHPDLVLLWRPHPMLFGALVNNGYMRADEMETFIAEKAAEDNIILDQSEDYHAAFEVSDALITDGTTFSMEYLGTGKPLMLTISDITQYYNHEEAEKGLYVAQNPADIVAFIEDVVCGQKDYKKAARQEYARKMLFMPENMSIAQHITECIFRDLQEDQIQKVRNMM